MNWILFGFKRCGKTHYGKKISALLSRPFIDTDQILETLYFAQTRERLSCREIYEHLGATAFRALESESLLSLQNLRRSIISVGGGMVLDPTNVEQLHKLGTLIYLKLDKETLKKRILSTSLPSYLDKTDPEGSFEKMYEERKSVYEKIRAIPLDISHQSETWVLEQLRTIIEGREHGIQ